MFAASKKRFVPLELIARCVLATLVILVMSSRHRKTDMRSIRSSPTCLPSSARGRSYPPASSSSRGSRHGLTPPGKKTNDFKWPMGRCSACSTKADTKIYHNVHLCTFCEAARRCLQGAGCFAEGTELRVTFDAQFMGDQEKWLEKVRKKSRRPGLNSSTSKEARLESVITVSI